MRRKPVPRLVLVDLGQGNLAIVDRKILRAWSRREESPREYAARRRRNVAAYKRKQKRAKERYTYP